MTPYEFSEITRISEVLEGVADLDTIIRKIDGILEEGCYKTINLMEKTGEIEVKIVFSLGTDAKPKPRFKTRRMFD